MTPALALGLLAILAMLFAARDAAELVDLLHLPERETRPARRRAASVRLALHLVLIPAAIGVSAAWQGCAAC